MDVHAPIVIFGLLIGAGLAIAGLVRPFLGVLVLLSIHFVQPGELVPALAAFNIERIYGIAVLAAFLLHYVSDSSRALFSNRIVRASFLLIGAACLSVPFSVYRGGAVGQTIGLTKNVIVLLLIAGVVDTSDRMRKLVWLQVGLLAWFAGSGMVSYLRGEFVFRQGIERAVGETSIAGGPNELAGLILALLPFLIVLIKTSGSNVLRLLLIGCGGLCLATIVVTGSRTAVIGLIVLAAFYVFRSRHKVMGFAVIAVLACLIWIAMPRQYQERYLTTVHFAEGSQLDGSNQLRLHIWKTGWTMFLDHPILGVGAGQFSTAYGTIYSAVKHGAWMNPHNLLIQVACELGLVGLLAFGYFVKQIVKGNLSILQLQGNGPPSLSQEVAVACMAFLACLVVISLFGHTLYRPYWYLLGGLVAANQGIADAALSSPEFAVEQDGEADDAESEPQMALISPFEEGRR